MTDGEVASRLGGGLLAAHAADVGTARERARQVRLRTLALLLMVPLGYLWARILRGDPLDLFGPKPLPPDWPIYVLPVAILAAVGLALAMPLLSGRSPHLLYRPEQLDVRLADVIGIDGVVDEVTRTLNTFLAHRLYRDRLGGSPRRGLLFEGDPGTGKTHLAKAMAREAGVPFLFVSATSFQSMWYGATARRIRSYFTALRKVARREGGAIGFIEEIDAIAQARGGLRAAAHPGSACAERTADSHATAAAAGLQQLAFASPDGASGVVNELLVQLQSFDTPPPAIRLRNAFASAVNRFLPAQRQLRLRPAPYHNILVIAATNRADALDPALLRPGRFDRRLLFERPAKPARRALLDHYLARKAHAEDLDREVRREELAAQTFGYTPVMVEHLLDEALVVSLRRGRDAMTWEDLQTARLETEIGLGSKIPYTAAERRRVATHEAGHAVAAYLADTRRLELLSIVKRSKSLGLLAHGDREETYTRTRREMLALVDIAMGGLAAERIWFGDAGTGPSSDLAYATGVACEIVGVNGMGSTLVSLAAVQRGALTEVNLAGRVLEDPVTRPQVEALLDASADRVQDQLAANRHLVEALRDALLERDELAGDDLAAVLAGAGPAVRDDLTVLGPPPLLRY